MKISTTYHVCSTLPKDHIAPHYAHPWFVATTEFPLSSSSIHCRYILHLSMYGWPHRLHPECSTVTVGNCPLHHLSLFIVDLELGVVPTSTLDGTVLVVINPAFDWPGRLQATFRCIALLFASSGVNLAASIARRTVRFGFWIRMLTASSSFVWGTRLVLGIVKDKCYMGADKSNEVNWRVFARGQHSHHKKNECQLSSLLLGSILWLIWCWANIEVCYMEWPSGPKLFKDVTFMGGWCGILLLNEVEGNFSFCLFLTRPFHIFQVSAWSQLQTWYYWLERIPLW